MISDERLREAARKVEESMLASLPDPEECKVPPPPEIGKRTRRASHPIRHRVMKAVACFLLVVLVGGGSVLTLSADARAAFVGWVREVYDTWLVYRFNNTTQGLGQDTVYRPAWIPDDYEEEHESEQPNKVNVIYKNSEDNMLIFLYSNDPSSIALYVDQEYKVVEQVEVGTNYADLYIDQREDAANEIVWTDSETGTIFLISAPLSGEDLLKIAESVTVVTHDE